MVFWPLEQGVETSGLQIESELPVLIARRPLARAQCQGRVFSRSS